MEDAALVGVLHGAGELFEHDRSLPRRERPLGDAVGEGAALDQFHFEEPLALVFAGARDADDVGMVELRGGLGLGGEAAAFIGRGEQAAADEFEGAGTIQSAMNGLIDHAHAAPGDFAEERVVLEFAQRVHGSVLTPALTGAGACDCMEAIFFSLFPSSLPRNRAV